MKILIVEDELLIAEQLEGILEANNCTVIGIAQDLNAATSFLQSKPELIFLDIQLKNNENGIAFGRLLQSKAIPFIYITANTEVPTLREAIRTNPVTYISKPFKNNDIIATLELVRLKNKLKPMLVLELTNKTVEIFLEDILYCEAKGSYTCIFTKEKQFMKRINLKDFAQHLDDNFVRVHRSFLVNKTQMSYKTATAAFFGTTEIPISKSYRNVLD